MCTIRIRRLIAAGLLSCVALSATADASQVGLQVAMSNPVLKAEKKQTTFLKVGLTGFKMVRPGQRLPVNVALVLDKSGSMSGTRIEEARKAAIAAIQNLNANDIVSVITYDSTVQVLVPATKLTDKKMVCARIASIQAGGRTALFAGVSKGAAELRKFLNRDLVNRIILLSDGKANVGPSSPSELGAFGKSLSKEGVTVSTLGLGLDYNEDLMVQLASQSGGNHVFIEDARNIAAIFKEEFETVLSVVAQEVAVSIEVGAGIRPVRVLGCHAEINGQKVLTQIAQIYSEQEKFIVLEVEIPASPEGKPRKIADVQISYGNVLTRATDRLAGSASVNFSTDAKTVSESVNRKVLAAGILLLANEQNKLATVLRDNGDVKGARRVLLDNVDYLNYYADSLNSDELQSQGVLNATQSLSLDPRMWALTRKQMRFEQYKTDTRQGQSQPIEKPGK